MAISRFYCPDLHPDRLPPSPFEFSLPEEEATHAVKALRMRSGDRLIAFNGQGDCWDATVLEAKPRHVRCQGTNHHHLPNVLLRQVTVAVAMPKGDRQRAVIEKLIEFGVPRFVPLVCHRSVAEVTPSALARLQRYSIEACKQCGRNLDLAIDEPLTLPEIASRFSLPSTNPISLTSTNPISLTSTNPISLPSTNPNLTSPSPHTIAWLTHPYPINPHPITHLHPTSFPTPLPDQPLLFAVGPEGGFTTEEASLATQLGFGLLSLGPRILRVENATSLVCSLAQWLDPPPS